MYFEIFIENLYIVIPGDLLGVPDVRLAELPWCAYKTHFGKTPTPNPTNMYVFVCVCTCTLCVIRTFDTSFHCKASFSFLVLHALAYQDNLCTSHNLHLCSLYTCHTFSVSFLNISVSSLSCN